MEQQKLILITVKLLKLHLTLLKINLSAFASLIVFNYYLSNKIFT